jgi:hypothetical protein
MLFAHKILSQGLLPGKSMERPLLRIEKGYNEYLMGY